MQPKDRRLVTEKNLDTELGPVKTTLVQVDIDSTNALSTAVSADRKSDDAVTRVEHIETVAGLAPGEVTDAQTANLIQRPESSTRSAFNTATAQVVYDIPEPTGSVQGDIDMVLSACHAATTEGRTTVTMGPGHYQLDGLTVSDVQDRYLVGDHVTFTWQSNVYPFTSDDLATLSANRGRAGGRGRIAIEVDDALVDHWRYLFPASKRLGITMGTAWHTDNGAEWVAEAYRHGWEIIAHLPRNDTATDLLAQGTLDAAAQSSLDKIEEVTGSRENIGFVYPQHIRSEETDRVLSKYFTRGRGSASGVDYPRGVGHPWFTSAGSLDNNFSDGTISTGLKRTLQGISTNDGQMVFFMHLNSGNQASQISALTDMVQYCRFLGIDIVNPGQIWTGTNIITDPYFTQDEWELSTRLTYDTDTKYHANRSIRFSETGGHGLANLGHTIQIPGRPGMYKAYRVSFRYKLDNPIEVSSAGQGLIWLGIVGERRLGNPIPTGAAFSNFGAVLPKSGTTIPPADWERAAAIIYLPPYTQRLRPRLAFQNITEMSSPLWVDELKWEFLEYVPSIVTEATLDGTGNVFLNPHTTQIGRQNIQLIPDEPPEGTVYVSSASSTGSQIIIKSTSPNDTMNVKVIITPTSSYRDLELPVTGA